MAQNTRLIDVGELLERMEQKYKETVRLIQSGETHLDNLAEGYTEVHILIGVAPSVEASPVRHGQWMFDDFDGDGFDYQCSVCQSYTRNGYRYCPNCGAKMDLGTNNEEKIQA